MLMVLATASRHGNAEVSERPVPVHRIEEGERGRWREDVPGTGHLFLATFPDGDGFIEVSTGPQGMEARAFRSPDTAAALLAAVSASEGNSEECDLRLVMTPEGEGVFWLDGVPETFVSICDRTIMSGPEFISRFLDDRALSGTADP